MSGTVALHMLECGFPDFSRRGIEDTKQRNRIERIEDDVEVGKKVFDFFARVEFKSSNDPVGDAHAHTGLLEEAGLRVGTVEDDLVIEGYAVPAELFDREECFACFFVFIGDFVDKNFWTFVSLRPHGLFWAVGVGGDDAIGGREDRLDGAVVLFQRDACGVRVILFEFQNIAKIRAAECVDGLIRVADNADIAILFGKEREEEVLGVVGVLVFIDMEVPPGFLVPIEDIGTLDKESNNFEDQIIKIDGIMRMEFFLVQDVCLNNFVHAVCRCLFLCVSR